jgi:uncharacterized phage protein (TIGR02220 family)
MAGKRQRKRDIRCLHGINQLNWFMAFRIDDKEMEILSGDNNSRLSHEAKLTYLLAIRPYMDFETGMAGTKRTISYQSIMEVIEYAPPKGSTRRKERYTKEKIRAILRELERCGLIFWVKNEDRGLFFECLKSARGNRQKNMNNPWETPEQPHEHNPKNNPEETRNNAAFSGVEQHQEQPVAKKYEPVKSNPPPESGIRDTTSLRSVDKEEINVVFDYWKKVTGKKSARLDDKRKKLVSARLKEGYSVEDLCLAIDGNKLSPFHQGNNDTGKVHDSLGLILRDAEKVDQFIGYTQQKQLARAGPRLAHINRQVALEQSNAIECENWIPPELRTAR